MSRWVVDANVVVKWFVAEPGNDKAISLLRGVSQPGDFAAPDLLFLESSNILWKYFRRGELTAEEAAVVFGEISAVNFLILPSLELAPHALEIATTVGCTVYDAAYVAVASALERPLITADAKLVRACAASQFSELVKLLDDWQP